LLQQVTERASRRNAARRKTDKRGGAVAQLGEHLLCKQGVTGSIPVSSTIFGRERKKGDPFLRFFVKRLFNNLE
jgi:hypothetical protein